MNMRNKMFYKGKKEHKFFNTSYNLLLETISRRDLSALSITSAT